MPGGSATVRISSKDVSFIPIVLYGKIRDEAILLPYFRCFNIIDPL